MRRHTILIFSVALFAYAASAADSAAFKLAVTESGIDWENCIAWGDKKSAGKAARETLLAILGLKPVDGEMPGWSTEPIGGVERHFRIAFSRPIEVGTLCTDFADESMSVSVLRESAAYPGEISDNAQWTPLSNGRVKTLAPNTRVRALRFTHKYSPMPWDARLFSSRLECCLLLTGRFWDPASLGTGEWSKFILPPRNDAKTKAAQKGGPADQWIGCWPKDLDIAGIAFFRRPPAESPLAILPAGVEDHALAPDTNKWTDIEFTSETGGPGATPLSKPVTARALRLRAFSYLKKQSTYGEFPYVLPLVALKNDEPAPTSFLPRAPFAFEFDMPVDGFAAMNIRDEKGNHVRRLIAEVPRAKGIVTETWDLKDDDGKFVPPGAYSWYGICRPPLKLTYEMTVYNAGNPPWFAPVRGGGSWMADHSPPNTICAVKDILVIASPGAEFGNGIIATNLDGNKIWGGPGQGAERLVSDGRYAYAVNNGSIMRIDPQNGFAQKQILTFHYTPEIPGHASGWIASDHSGVACRDGKLYISYDGSSAPWIRSSAGGGDVDLDRCFPPPFREKTHETAYGPAERLLGTFLMINSSQQAVYGKTMTSGPLKKTLVLALKKDLPIGSVLIPDGEIRVFALKPGKPFPAWLNAKAAPTTGLTDEKPVIDDINLGLGENADSRFDDANWIQLKSGPRGLPAVAVPVNGMRTRMLAFTGKNLESLDFSLLLDRRYRNASGEAKLITLEGEKPNGGGWTTKRGPNRPISANDPPIAGLLWEKPTALRGFALIRPMEWAGVAVDVWSGEPDAAITDASFKDNALWRQVHVYHKSDNGVKFGWHTDKVIIGDFGATLDVRALRVRIIDPPRPPLSNPAGTIFSGGFSGLVAFQPIGNDVELPTGLGERITVVELPKTESDSAQILKHIPLLHPGAMAFDKSGALFVKSTGGIVRISGIDSATGTPKPELVIPFDQAPLPRSLFFDAENTLYVLDGDSRTIKIFDATHRKLVRSIGTPDGNMLGPWDPAHFDAPSFMTLDANGKIWVTEQSYQPKRVSRWTRDGAFEKEFLGPTNYGGGGYMDPGDHTVVNHLGMKFKINYATRTWKMESRYNAMNSRGAFSPDRILRAQGHRYMIGDHSAVLSQFNDHGPTMQICEEKDGIAIPMVAAGLVGGLFAYEKSDELREALGAVDPDKNSFLWSDKNRDGKIQKDEVAIVSGPKFRNSTCVGDDLSLNFNGWRVRPIEIRADGLPLYDINSVEAVPEMSDSAMVTEGGESFVLANKFLDRTGKIAWTYLDQWSGVGRSNATPFGFTQRPPGVLAGTISPLGHFKADAEDFFCVNGNHGDYFAFTRDGLLAASILGGPAGYGRRFFSSPDCEPGKTDLSDLRATVENFRGHICAAEDGNIYAIVGKNHVTVIRVDGLAAMRRVSGKFEVKASDIQATTAWSAEATRIARTLLAPKIFTVAFRARKPKIDGDITTDWPRTQPMEIHKGAVVQGVAHESTVASLSFDTENLYIAARAVDDSPMVNSGQDWKKLFQQGDGFDLHLGLDPAADPKRTAPVPGDIRVVITIMNGTPTAVLYRYKVKSPSLGGEPVKFTSPVGETEIDEVVMLKDCLIEFRRSPKSWVLEAAIPWKSLGTKAPESRVVLRGDVGVLVSDPDGISTVTRMYWANRSVVVMSDLPSEARVIPSLWGELRFDTLRLDEEFLKDE